MKTKFKYPSGKSNKDVNFFGASIPGQSLTDAPGIYPWDKPPKYANIDDAYTYVRDQLYTDEGVIKIMDLLEMNVPPTTIAKSVVIMGWMRGLWNPDVAEMLKQAVSVDITLIGTEADIEMTFNKDRKNKTVDWKSLYNKRKKELNKETDNSVVDNIQDALEDRQVEVSKKGLMSR